jgi:RNA polymerase sigma-70 factor (ECF subfamily)
MDIRRREFDALIRRLAPELYRYAWWLCRDSALAQDLVQEACLRAWRSVDALRDDGAAKSWLLTIIRREHARLYERKRLPLEDIAEVVIEDEDSPDVQALMEVQQMRDAILRIEPKYREPLLLQVIGGYTCEEIASQLGLSAQAVMTQVFRARAKLKAQLQQGGEGKVHELL